MEDKTKSVWDALAPTPENARILKELSFIKLTLDGINLRIVSLMEALLEETTDA